MYLKQWIRGLSFAAALTMVSCSGGKPPLNLGVTGGRLASCPDSPNCVSSQATDAGQRVEPLRYASDAPQARNRLLRVMNGMDRAHIQRAEADYIHAEFSSALWGFVDDVEFHFDPPGVIQVRSGSRTGYYDFGVNRQRVETLRARFSAPAE